MANAWIVAGRCVEWPLAHLYSEARQRVLRSPKLSKYMQIIMDDAWAGDEDHLRWVTKAKVGDIYGWAMDIEGQRR